MTKKQETWDSWTDVLGNRFWKGDTIAVAIVSYGSEAELVIGTVVQINRTTQEGDQITTYKGGHRVPSCSVKIAPTARGNKFGALDPASMSHKNKTQVYQNPGRMVKIGTKEIEPQELEACLSDLLSIEAGLREL